MRYVLLIIMDCEGSYTNCWRYRDDTTWHGISFHSIDNNWTMMISGWQHAQRRLSETLCVVLRRFTTIVYNDIQTRIQVGLVLTYDWPQIFIIIFDLLYNILVSIDLIFLWHGSTTTYLVDLPVSVYLALLFPSFSHT